VAIVHPEAAADALPHFEEEARKRQGMRTDIREKIPEGSYGKAADPEGGLPLIGGETRVPGVVSQVNP